MADISLRLNYNIRYNLLIATASLMVKESEILKRFFFTLCLVAAPILQGCETTNPYQQVFDNYAMQLNQAVQRGDMTYAEAEQLKLEYANQLNQASIAGSQMRQQRVSNYLSSRTKCRTRPDYMGGWTTDCR